MKQKNDVKPTGADNSVAIIGMGCLFPGSAGLKAYLQLLIQGRDAVGDPPQSHAYLNQYLDDDPKKPDHIYCNRGGYLPQVNFDPTAFGIPPNVLEATDTSQLLSLLVATSALEDAGYGNNGRSFHRQKTSVILGVTGTQELVIPLSSRLGHPVWKRALEQSGITGAKADEVVEKISRAYVGWQENSFPGLLGNVVAGRICNRLDLGGTNCVVDAACASSMGAIHLAVLELESGRSDMVITGGADTINDVFMHMCFSKTMILSESGNARPFSSRADGTVLGEGIGLVVLKRLQDAVKDKDRIYAVIKGIGSASDGKSNGIYAPRLEGQVEALQRAYRLSGVDPASVEMVEAHGTGTRVGDQVEFKALCRVFRKSSPTVRSKIALGSVKSNIGHTKAAAGTAGLIKACLALYHKALFPTLKADPVDPKLELEKSPFYINTRLRPWVGTCGQPRRAGVSAFGFGGSNFHAVIEEFNSEKEEVSWDGRVQLAAFCAESISLLQDQLARFRKTVVQKDIDSRTTEIETAAAESRSSFDPQADHRLIVVFDLQQSSENICRIFDQVAAGLSTCDLKSGHLTPESYYGFNSQAGKVAFLFPGQASQYPFMGAGLGSVFPEFLEILQDAEHAFERYGSLAGHIFPVRGNHDQWEANLRQTQVAQPAIGAVSAAMSAVLKRFNLAPDFTCGHSYGELTALHEAGWISRADFLRLSVLRGRTMFEAAAAKQDPGSMLAVRADAKTCRQILESVAQGLVIANINSPLQTVLSGGVQDIEKAAEYCRQQGISAARLPVAAAFHSELVSDAAGNFSKAVAGIDFSPTSVEVIANTTARAYPHQRQAAVKLLGNQLSKPVRFMDSIGHLYHDRGVRLFVEVGPRRILSQLASQILEGEDAGIVALDRSSGNKWPVFDLAHTIAHAAAFGLPVKLDRWEKPPRFEPKPRLSVKLCGANYRLPDQTVSNATVPKTDRKDRQEAKQKIKYVDFKVKSNTKHKVKDDKMQQEKFVPIAKQPQSEKSPAGTGHQYRPADGNLIDQGIKALQDLHRQTALAHQKFLETQAQAASTLEKILGLGSGTQDRDDSSCIQPEVIAENYNPSAGHRHKHNPESISRTHGAEPVPSCPNIASEDPDEKVSRGSQDSEKTFRQTEDIASVLVETVSRLTGYPEQMLELDMDIEADLGIDSIKRVEILSAVEQALPGLAKIGPEQMGKLKTLGQICDFLARGLPEDHSTGSAEPPAETVSAPEGSGRGKEDIASVLVETVSRLTGYPEQMLELDMDIEADLGIDSIKRVEILSAVEQALPGLAKIGPEQMGKLKTLGQICDFLARDNSGQSAVRPAAATGRQKPGCKFTDGSTKITKIQEADFTELERRTIKPVPCPIDTDARLELAVGAPVIICSQDRPKAELLGRKLEQANLKTLVVGGDDDLDGSITAAGGLILVAPIDAERAFKAARHCAPLLVNGRDRFFLTLTFMDGSFGFGDRMLENPTQGALAGLLKTAAREWPTVRCLALDMDPGWQNQEKMAESVLEQILYCPGPSGLEIGLGPEGRIVLEMEKAEFTASLPQIGPEDVVLITGGARGITAQAALALACHCRPAIALVGRSARPFDEPDWLAGLEDQGGIKQAILENLFTQGCPSPRKLEEAYAGYMANRQIRASLEAIRQAGSRVGYFQADVRDRDQMTDVVRRIRKTWGPVTAFIHGAGVLADKTIDKKSDRQFRSVYSTKVQGWKSLVEACADEPLAYVVNFSSVTARMGNSGQADYAMANEALNKLAADWAKRNAKTKVVSINWGPWDGGMVDEHLKRNFLGQGVGLIPLQAGARAMLAEMAASSGPVEVVIGSVYDPGSEPDSCRAEKKAELGLAFKCDISLATHPVLDSHRLDGKPVVPIALLTEWLGHGAMHANPGLCLLGMDDCRLLKGVVLDQESRTIGLMAGKASRRDDNTYKVPVEIRDGFDQSAPVIHFRAEAILAEVLPRPPAFDKPHLLKEDGDCPDPKQIYDQMLFHGLDLRGIRRILRIDSHGLTAELATAPHPRKWLKEPLRGNWITDPLVLDCAFQMAIVWSRVNRGMPSLPSYFAAYRQYVSRFPKQGLLAVMEVKKASGNMLYSDFSFVNHKGLLAARLSGCQAVMDPNLERSFNAN